MDHLPIPKCNKKGGQGILNGCDCEPDAEGEHNRRNNAADREPSER